MESHQKSLYFAKTLVNSITTVTLNIFTKDCELSSSQSHTSPQIVEIEGLKTEVVVRRSVGAGVKVCGASDCNYTVSTAQRIHRCKSHSSSRGLQKSEQCPVTLFTYGQRNLMTGEGG